MAPFGSFGAGRRVVVGVSGGADSLALAWLLRRWGDPLAVIVDHGLRAESGAEAVLTAGRLAGMGVEARIVGMARGQLMPGADIGARARAARYGALLGVCWAEGLVDLLVAHHAQDQAETHVLRAAAGSGAAGLAGMAAVGWRGEARVLRPLLGVAPGRLRATLQAAGVGWVEDPGNRDPSTARGRLRVFGGVLGAAGDGAMAAAARAGVVRRAAEGVVAGELGAGVSLFPEGYAVVGGGVSEAGWSRVVWTVSGRAYPPGREGVRRLAESGGGTLHGVMVRGGLVVREAAAMEGEVRAGRGVIWDGRFRLGGEVGASWTIGALGVDAARLRRRSVLPSIVLRTLPALRFGTDLLVVPHLAYPDGATCRSVQVDFCPAHPLAGAAFVPA